MLGGGAGVEVLACARQNRKKPTKKEVAAAYIK
jgi:hypothetical protein